MPLVRNRPPALEKERESTRPTDFPGRPEPDTVASPPDVTDAVAPSWRPPTRATAAVAPALREPPRPTSQQPRLAPAPPVDPERALPPVGREGDAGNPVAVWTVRQGGQDVVFVRNVDGGSPVRLGTLETVAAGTPLYHWNADAVMRQWTQQGGVPPAEMERRVSQNMHSMGGGVYVSLNPADCQQFGANLMVFTPAKPFRVVRYERLMGDLEASLRPADAGAGRRVTRETLNQALLLANASRDVDGALAGSYSVAPGAQTTGLPSTWMNLLREDVLGAPRLGTLADFAPFGTLASARSPTDVMAQLLRLDATKNVDVRGYAELPNAHPLLARWLRGEPLTPADRASLWGLVRPALQTSVGRSGDPIDLRSLRAQRSSQPLLAALWRTFGSELEGEVAASLEASGANKPLPLGNLFPLPSETSRAAAELGGLDARFGLVADLATLASDGRKVGSSEVPPAPAFLTSPHLDREVEVRDAFGKRLLAALALGTPKELGAAMSRLTSPFETPSVARLQLDRFEAVRRSGVRRTPMGVQLMHAALTDPGFDLAALNGQAPRGATPLRATEAWEEGDVTVDGTRYLRIRAAEAEALRANPFVTPEFRVDASSPDGATVLARWAYPSALTWRRFARFLPPALVAQLESAGDLKERPADAAHFTRVIVQSLLEYALGLSHVERVPSLSAQVLASIHPFDAGNDALVRAVVARASPRRQPVMLGDVRNALLQSPDAFALTIAAGQRRYERAVLGLSKVEEAEPQSPRFYESPELWQAVLDQPARADASAQAFALERAASP